MKVVGLFAGVGGLETGLAAAGHETIALSEIWAPACAVLKARIDAPNLGDVQEISSLPDGVDLLTAGFPCQDLSQAGRTAGIGGKKSGLVEHVFRLLDKTPVDWVLLENVSFMLRLDGGAAMERLVRSFEERNYRWAYRVVNTQAYLPQRRERVFFLASRTQDPADILFADDVTPHLPATDIGKLSHGFYWTEGVRGLGWAPDAVPPLKNGSTVGIASPPAILMPNGLVVTPDIRDAERLQGLPENWTAPAEATGRASWRWSLVGNAVSAPVAAWIGRRLGNPSPYDRSLDKAFGGRWPRAARFDGVKRQQVQIGDFPCFESRPHLHEFLQFPGKPLSLRATTGFLKRANASSLRFPEGFLMRVEAHKARMEQSDIPIAA